MIRGHIPLENIFGLCIFFRKLIKRLGFDLELRISNRKQDVFYTTLGDNTVDVAFNCLNAYIQTIIPSPGTQKIFNEAITKSFTLSHES